jgi:hypothetical protein
MSTPEKLEQRIVSLLEQTCIPDTETVKRATKQLRKDLKRPAVMIVLTKLFSTHPEAAVRSIAAVVVVVVFRFCVLSTLERHITYRFQSIFIDNLFITTC